MILLVANVAPNNTTSINSSEGCEELCIPERPFPVSCTDKYPIYKALVIELGETPLEEQRFCDEYLAYLVDDYRYYLQKSGVLDTTENPKALHINYMSIQRFGSTAFNYGYSGIRPIINAYVSHVTINRDNAKTWAAFTADYLINNPDICVPNAFPVPLRYRN